MSRWLFPWSGSIKKRACRYLLQHYLGHFLEERLSLDQLSLDLYNGSGVIREINLDVWAVNELLESLGAPLEIVEGFVNSITVTIPWAALVTEHCTLEITGLQITCRPKYRTSEFYGNWDSQGWSSCMTSSMQLAQECLKDPPEASEEPPAPLEGLEMFAQTIETVLRRIKVTFLDTIVRVEHHSLDAETGVALEMVDYCDEAVRDSSQTVPVDIHQPPAFLHKILQLNSVQLLYETLGGSQVRETIQPPLLIGQCSGFIETTVKIKQNEMLPGPKQTSQYVFKPVLNNTLCVSLHSIYVFSCNPSSVFVFLPIERSSRSSQSEPLKPDSLLRLSLGGVTLTLLEQDPPPGPDGLSSLAEVSQLFFHELAFFKDGMFSERDFHNLRGSFAKACPHSHIRMTGAAVQLTCEMRGAGRHTRATTSDLSFSRLELLECLWESGGPQYTEVRCTPANSCTQMLLFTRPFWVCSFESNPLSFSLQSHLLELHSSLLLQSPYAVVKVRFPIPDLRPPGLRRPLSQRAVRSEILSLQISNLELKSQQGPDIQQDGPCSPGAKLTKLLEACFTDMHGEFPLVSICRIQVRVNEGAGSDCTGVCEGVNRDLGLGSMSLENPCELREKNSSPFSSNRTMFETEEMVIPADPEEMDEFQTQCICQCQYVVDITFPVAYILLPSKEAFLSIYNRYCSTLHENEILKTYLQALVFKSSFQFLIFSLIIPESDSEEEEPQFFSAKQSKRRKPLEPQSSHALSLLCLTVLIGKGRLQAMTDCKNEAGRKMDFCHGELVLDLEGGKIFSVSQHQNNPNLNFLTIESRRVELYHKAEVPDSPIPVKLEMPRFTSPGHLDPTIYPTEVGVSSVGGRETDVQMLSTAIKITLDLERNVKEFLVALRLHGATLRHHMALTNHSWHEQIVDFLDVIDDDILGYTPPAVITVLHTHLATCAVDYRPLYLPLRVLFTAESFSLSSNMFINNNFFFSTGIITAPLNNAGTLHTLNDQLNISVNTGARMYVLHVNIADYMESGPALSESPASLPPCPPAETAEINQCDLTDALIDTERILQEETQDSGSPSIRRASPVSVYLFPGEAPKLRPSVLEEEESDIDGLVSTAMEAHADMMSEEGSEGSTDNDDFCILEAPGMGIPVCTHSFHILLQLFKTKVNFTNNYKDTCKKHIELNMKLRTDVPQKASDDTDPGSGLGHDLSASVETTYSEQSSSSAGSSSSSDQPIYFREFRFTSEVPIWLDYHGKHVVIEQGTFAGILIGLAQLNCSELKLKRLCCRHGLLGVDKVIQYAVNEWLTDIRKNQLPGILGGVGPMHSVVQLIHGVRDLFWMPIEQYRKDGRIIRGLQRGAASFGTSTASAALELSNRLVQAIQATAETVYDILSPTPPLTRYITDGRPTPRPRRTPQPADLREGVAKAYDTVREGVIDTAQTLCDVASRGHEQKGLPGAVGGVLRQIPPTVVRPLIVASEATSNLLGGMRNQIKPDARKEDFLKWRTEDGQE
uniref:Autophagy related 2A n=1 Tax=Sinocyclocheilus grahami TaxID=75366 RepID=A0A672MWR9_SINGR